jgi:L-fuconolactonase
MASPDPVWLDGPEGEPLWREAVDLDLVISVLIEPAQLPRLARAARRYPDARIVVDHLGRCTPRTPPDEQAVLLQLAELPNVSLKISALSSLSGEPFPYTGLHALIEQCYRAYGPDRLLWGTDFPHILEAGPYELALDAVRDGLPFIDTAHLTAILGGNAHRLYRLPETWGHD